MSEPVPVSPLCGIPGHPEGAHGGHPGCQTHGDMHYKDGVWVCLGFDGEGCSLPPQPDAWTTPRSTHQGGTG